MIFFSCVVVGVKQLKKNIGARISSIRAAKKAISKVKPPFSRNTMECGASAKKYANRLSNMGPFK